MSKRVMYCYYQAAVQALAGHPGETAAVPVRDLQTHIRWPKDPPTDVDLASDEEFDEWCSRLPVPLERTETGWMVRAHGAYMPAGRKCHMERAFLQRIPVAAAHEQLEIIYVWSGSCCCEVEGQKLLLKAGEFLFLAPEVRHSVRTEVSESIVFSIHLYPNVLTSSAFCALYRSAELSDFLLKLDAPSRRGWVRLSQQPQFFVCRILKQLLYACNLDEGPDEPIADTILPYCSLLLTHAVILSVYGGNTFQDLHRDRFSYLRQIHSYVQDHYRDATLEDMASALHLSKSYTCTLIRELTGKTFSEYLRTARMTEACELLSRTEASIADIGEMVGYSDCSYFIRLFRAEFAMTPAQYRKAVFDRNTGK